MKCPKCGYISFDYNVACPKCNKDITSERGRMGLPSYRPATPSLLGALTGEANESSIGLEVPRSGGTSELEQEMGLSFEDSQAIEAMEVAFEDSQDLEIELEAAPEPKLEESSGAIDLSNLPQETDLRDLPLEESAEDLSLDLEGLAFEDAGADHTEQDEGDEFVLEPDPAYSGGSGTKEPAEGLSLDLEDLTFDEEPHDKEADTPEVELDGLFDEEEKASNSSARIAEENEEILLDLGDLEGDSSGGIELKLDDTTEEGDMDLEILDLDLELEDPE